MPLEEAASLWRAYLTAFTQLLSQMAGDPHSAAGKRLARLYYETLQLWGALMSSQPDRAATILRRLLVSETWSHWRHLPLGFHVGSGAR